MFWHVYADMFVYTQLYTYVAYYLLTLGGKDKGGWSMHILAYNVITSVCTHLAM